ncbi:Proto-oncogene tyrosine-protein kinase receptor Ret-like [Homarus americanus]|uniref:Proto-oncogene tyrosine-protein kinase receptor Ret-like n=1 Tax=Homarus americanus TaxID=6706 RepID=A0A8J5N1V7_HOMAM|nr:Proto-oncogene tyrosine-protein kinase receptor Ret-like [Homarus americanus]
MWLTSANVTQIDPECYNYNKRGGGEYNTYDSGDESLLDNGVLNITIIVGDSFNCDKPRREGPTPLTLGNTAQPLALALGVHVATLDLYRLVAKSDACFLPDEDTAPPMGNRDVTPLLEMPSFIDFCPGMVAFYSITMPGVENGRQELQTDSDRLIVRPTAPLDRELRGDSLPFTIKCTLRLDDQLLVLDPDLTDTNNYMVELIGNIYNLVTIESVTEFGIRSENLLPSIAQEKKQVKYSVTLTLPNYEEEVKPTPLHALTHNTDNGVLSPETIALLKELPPSELNITIIPVNVSIKVTPITGILYVSDPDGLRSGEFTIVRGDSVTLVTLTVVEQVNFPCSSQNPEEVTPWCASIRYSSECQETCGLGAAGTCSWRPLETEKGKTQYTKYATCSPALDTYYQTRPSPSPGVEPPLKEPAPASSLACGRGCKVGISVAAVVFLGFTLLSVVFCRRHASGNGKQKGGVISLGTLANEERSSSVPYNTRDETHDSLIHGIRASPRPDHNLVPALNLTPYYTLLHLFTPINTHSSPSTLILHLPTPLLHPTYTLLHPESNTLSSSAGYTTVAVKMLKSNSTQVELSDLLSEYTLLKEVSHPNVVRLLGACTGKGGPVYIIIEYCQYGSLRNYLKRSRHAEFENRVGSGPTEIAAGDYAITPKDLLSFAWQICKGMAYLTDMKLVHRDLAARNVLLAAGKVCKISDFGLTRDVYEGDLYFKRSKGRVPVKWMALESLVDHVYTSKSDVWGFGVLLWELVTLGTPPYPGVTPERLFSLLKAGYRMEKPDNCSQELYDVMLQCWAEDPARRPCFQELTDIFDAMIQADVEYLELRSLIVTNRGYFDGVPEPSQQFLEAPPQFQDSPQPPVGPINEEREASTQGSTHQGAPPQLNIDETQLPIQQAAHTPTITTSHAHNPAYSPTSEIPHPTPLHYSTLASRPDEEDAHNLECCRSEEDSDSGRATGDSGYATEEGRGRWRAEHKGGSRPPQASPRGSSYSPVPHHDQDDDDDQDPEGDHDDDQDTSEDLEERQELLTEDLLGHLTPSPEPAQTAHTTAHTHNAAHATTHTTPVIVT